MGKDIQARLERIESLLSEIGAAATRPLDVDEAAAYLHQSKSYVYMLTSKGLIGHFKPSGKKIFFLKQDLDRYMLRHRRAPREEIDAAAVSHVTRRPAAEAQRFRKTRSSTAPRSVVPSDSHNPGFQLLNRHLPEES